MMRQNKLAFDKGLKTKRMAVHIGFSILLFIVIIVFNQLGDQSVIWKLFKWAGYTYGPLMALYFIGLFTTIHLRDKLVPLVLYYCTCKQVIF